MARAKKTSSKTPSPDEVVEAADGGTPEAEPASASAAEPTAGGDAAKAARKPRKKTGPDAAGPGETHVETAEHALAKEAGAEPAAEPSGDTVTEPASPESGEAATELSPEDLTEAVSEPMAETPLAAASPQTAPHEQGSGGGFVAGLIGGALAIAAGVGALWLSNPDLLRGEAPEPDFSPIEARLDEQAADSAALSEELSRLSSTVAALPQEAPDTPALESRIDTIEGDLTARLDALSAALDVLEGRIGQVEVRPPVMEGGASEAAEQVVAEMRAALDAQRAEIEALVEETRGRIEAAEAEAAAIQATAETAARAAVARASLARLHAALEAGGPFAAALSELSEVVDGPIPAALIATADTGVPTLADLRRAYPEPARAALAASIRADMPEDAGAMQRIGAFLRSQTGARSTEPRAGDDPDAVLSRAEGALAEGQIAAALELLEALPEAGKAEMAAWRSEAEARLAAVEAAEALAAALPAN